MEEVNPLDFGSKEIQEVTEELREMSEEKGRELVDFAVQVNQGLQLKEIEIEEYRALNRRYLSKPISPRNPLHRAIKKSIAEAKEERKTAVKAAALLIGRKGVTEQTRELEDYDKLPRF